MIDPKTYKRNRNLRRATFILCAWLVVLSQPQDAKADPISAAITASIANLTVSAVIASIVKALIASAILGGIGSLLSKKPKGGGSVDTSRTQMVKEPISPRQIILGRTRVSGAITFLNTYANHKRVEYNVTFAGHPCDAVEQVYFDDRLLTLDANGKVINAVDKDGVVDDTWINNATVKIGLGTPETDAAWSAYAIGQTAGDWTVNHKQTGCSKIWITLNLSNKPGGNSVPNVSLVVRGLKCLDPRTGVTAWTMNPALCLRQYLVQVGIVDNSGDNINDTTTIATANACDETVDSAAVTYPVTKVWQVGDGTQTATSNTAGYAANLLNFTSPHPFNTGDSVMVEAVNAGVNSLQPMLPASLNPNTVYFVNKYTANNIFLYATQAASISALPGVGNGALTVSNTNSNTFIKVTRYVQSTYFDSLTLNVGAATRLKTGEQVKVSSTGTLPTGLAANTTYYVVVSSTADNTIKLASSYSNAMSGVTISFGSAGTGSMSVIKSAESRYTCNGVVSSETQPIDSIPDILSSMIGTLAYIGGAWYMTAGVYVSPTISFDENDLDGHPVTQTKISLRDSFNSVKGTYFSPTAYYEQDSFPAVKNDFYISEDGVQVWNTISLPMTNSPGMCQRIAKASLEAIRQQITTTWPMKLTAMQAQVGSIVNLNRSRLGWVNKPFQITNWQLVTRGSGEDTRLGVDVTFREVAPTMFDWNNGEETLVDLSPNTNLPNAFIVAPPGTPIVTEREVLVYDSQSVKSVVDIAWEESLGPNVNAYQIEYKLSADTDWTRLPLQGATSLQATINDGLPPGVYDFRVKAINNLGVSSAYSTLLNKEILAQLQVPSNITGLTIQEVSSLAVLRWNTVPELSVRYGGSIHIRHSEAGVSLADTSNSVESIPAVSGAADHAVVPLKAGTYLVYAVNAAGVPSATPAKVSSAGAEVLTFSTVGTVQEDPIFPGTNNSTVVDSSASVLKLLGTGLWDDIVDFDAVPDVDDTGGVVTSGFYDFSAGIDLVTKQQVRLLTRLDVEIVNTTNLFDSRTTFIDSWTDFDGIAQGIVANAFIQVRYTDDNPLGSPTWSQWNWLVNAFYNARAFQFRVLLSTNDATYNIYVKKLGVTALKL